MRTRRHSEKGFTLVELLVSVLLSSLIFAGAIAQYSELVGQARDHQIKLETLVQAQAIVQTMANEIRMLGNGVPFDQPNFEIGELALSDPLVTHPITVATASATNLTFRLNENGEVYLLTADFTPGVTPTIQLHDVSRILVNDPIYISNSVMSGDDGLYGTVAAVDQATKSVTLAANYVAPAGAVFPMGSILEEVPNITYTAGAEGITRDSGFGPVLLGAKATIKFDYLDYDGNVMTLPLTADQLVTTLRSIQITVKKESERKLSDGVTYDVEVTQRVGIRNLNLYF